MTAQAYENVNSRNIQVLAENNKRLNKEMIELQDKYRGLESQYVQMAAKLSVMEQFINVMKIRIMGSGPTAGN